MARQSASVQQSPVGSLWRWLVVVALLGALVGGLIMFQPWANIAQSSGRKHESLKPETPLLALGNPVAADRQRDEFASDRDGGDTKPVIIDGKRAMGYLEAICKIGPRISGTEGMKKQQQLIEKHFKNLKIPVRYQKFEAKQRSQRKSVAMANMIISFHPERKRRVILCSHYDTRPIADQEGDRRNWKKPFVSANDGASGVALLMELANHMKDLKTEVGVDFVLFDGEEYVFDRDDLYFFGSKHFAREAAKNRRKTTYTGAILLDMIAGKGATFPVEENSWLKASKLVREVWNIAGELKCRSFRGEQGPSVLDDHTALNAGGIPAIDIIDFSYRHWHLLSDTPKNCSAEPMIEVGKVLSVWLQRQK